MDDVLCMEMLVGTCNGDVVKQGVHCTETHCTTLSLESPHLHIVGGDPLWHHLLFESVVFNFEGLVHHIWTEIWCQNVKE